jgi:hypothetical protein
MTSKKINKREAMWLLLVDLPSKHAHRPAVPFVVAFCCVVVARMRM